MVGLKNNGHIRENVTENGEPRGTAGKSEKEEPDKDNSPHSQQKLQSRQADKDNSADNATKPTV